MMDYRPYWISTKQLPVVRNGILAHICIFTAENVLMICSMDTKKADLTAGAGLAAILIALHHGNRGKVLGRPHRIEASVRFLEEILF